MTTSHIRYYQPGTWTRVSCDKCQADLEFLLSSKSDTYICPSCSTINQVSVTTDGSTQDVDTTYYEILEVSRSATQAQIKKAYHQKSRLIHPDKTNGTTTAAFLELQEAYNILSNEDSRAVYDKHGRNKAADDISDIQARFGGLFGGNHGRFDEWIGEIEIISEMGNAIRKTETSSETTARPNQESDKEGGVNEDNETGDAANLDKRRAEKKRDTRIRTLARNLRAKLDLYDPKDPAKFEAAVQDMIEDLKSESFGTEILNVMGNVYTLTASSSEYHPSYQSSWTGTWIPSLRMKGLYISSTYSTLRKAYRVKSAFAKLEKQSEGADAKAPKDSRLEEEAAKAAIEAIWEGVRAEVIGVIADTSKEILMPDDSSEDPQGRPLSEKEEIEGRKRPEPKIEERKLLASRALALEKLGSIFQSVKKEAGHEDIFSQMASGTSNT